MTTSVLLRCEHCGAGLRVASGKVRPGSSATCPKCRRVFQVPGAPAPEPATEELQCQICGALLRLRSDKRPAAGGTARCPRCQSAVVIPPLPGAAPAASPPTPAGVPPAWATMPPAPAAAPPEPAEPEPGPAAPEPAFAPPPAPSARTPAPASDSDMMPAGITPSAAPPTPPADAPPGGAGDSSWLESNRAGVPPAPRLVPPPPAQDEEMEEEHSPRAGSGDEEPVIEIQGDEEPAAGPPTAGASAQPSQPRRSTAPLHYPSRQAAPAAFWTVEIGGETLKPGGVAALRLWARQGKLRPDDKVRRGDGPWQVAREIPELASLFPRVRTPGKPAASPRAASEARRGWLAGLLGGSAALLPVLALLIFSGELESLVAAAGLTLTAGLGTACGVILLSGALVGRTLAGLQNLYESRGEPANVWCASGALGAGGGVGLLLGLAATRVWPTSPLLTLLGGFAVYGVSVAFLSLISYRWLFVERRP